MPVDRSPRVDAALQTAATVDSGSAACWIAADVGATHARFQVQDADGRPLLGGAILPTAELGDGAPLAALLRGFAGNRLLRGVCLGVAGPVIDGRTSMVNGRVALEEAALAAALRCPVRLGNDFFVLAHGLDRFQQVTQLGGGAVTGAAVRAVLGPGSGLGMAICLPGSPGGGDSQVLASEGGRALLAARTPLEAEILAVLAKTEGYLCWETLLSGPGLELLYRALAEVQGAQRETLAASAITAAALARAARPDRQPCTETVDLFLGFLGACAGDLALTTHANGGVYLVGNILTLLGPLVSASPLRARFDDRGPLTEFMRAIPLLLVQDSEPGLIGASVLAAQLAAQFD